MKRQIIFIALVCFASARAELSINQSYLGRLFKALMHNKLINPYIQSDKFCAHCLKSLAESALPLSCNHKVCNVCAVKEQGAVCQHCYQILLLIPPEMKEGMPVDAYRYLGRIALEGSLICVYMVYRKVQNYFPT